MIKSVSKEKVFICKNAVKVKTQNGANMKQKIEKKLERGISVYITLLFSHDRNEGKVRS